MNTRVLITMLHGLGIILILRVLATIVANYPDYFPPSFDSLFLQGRESTFTREYQLAFYLHIVCGPFVLLSGLLLLSESVRSRCRGLHRALGRVHVALVLMVLLPTSVVMSWYAFGGWQAGLSFILLSAATGISIVSGVVSARRRNYQRHRRWMIRSYVLICSAIMLRLISGAIDLVGVSSPELAYIVAAWSSWLVPLAILETLAIVPHVSILARLK